MPVFYFCTVCGNQEVVLKLSFDWLEERSLTNGVLCICFLIFFFLDITRIVTEIVPIWDEHLAGL